MTARAPLIRAARCAATGTAALMISALMVSLSGPDAAHAQQQPANQELQQFGPRANQAPRQQQQQRRQQAPKPEVIATHGDWAVQCQEEPTGATGSDGAPAVTRACGMTQSAQSDRPGVGLTLVVVKAQQEGNEVTMLRVMAPIGVYLPTGVALEIDGDAVGRVPFTRCMPQACMAIAEASPPTLDRMKKGGIANFIIYESPGNGMGMELSLKGFTAALAELNKL